MADALTGQDAVNLAKSFDERVGITGIVLTRMDGDGRGGAALSMRAVTGKPIKLVGTGEKMEALDDFHPQRVANRILGMGDIVSLVERAAETIDAAEAMKIAEKMKKGKFDLDDLSNQLGQMEKLGGLGGIMGMLPGMGKMKDQLAQAGMNDGMIKRQRAIISSMTPKERRNPDLLKNSRKKRIAAGSGTKVEELNRLLKQHRQMADMMKMMGGAGGKKGGALGKMASMFGMGGNPLAGMPEPTPGTTRGDGPPARCRAEPRPPLDARFQQAAETAARHARPRRPPLAGAGGRWLQPVREEEVIPSLRAQRSNPEAAVLDCFVASLLAMTAFGVSANVLRFQERLVQQCP